MIVSKNEVKLGILFKKNHWIFGNFKIMDYKVIWSELWVDSLNELIQIKRRFVKLIG